MNQAQEPDVARLTLSRSTTGVTPTPKKLPRPRPRGRFLKGPIPWDWLTRAARLSTSSAVLKVALLIWFQAGLKATDTVRLSGDLMESWNLTRFSLYRAVDKLEEANLVTVNRARGRGRKLAVTIRAVADDGSTKTASPVSGGGGHAVH